MTIIIDGVCDTGTYTYQGGRISGTAVGHVNRGAHGLSEDRIHKPPMTPVYLCLRFSKTAGHLTVDGDTIFLETGEKIGTAHGSSRLNVNKNYMLLWRVEPVATARKTGSGRHYSKKRKDVYLQGGQKKWS